MKAVRFALVLAVLVMAGCHDQLVRPGPRSSAFVDQLLASPDSLLVYGVKLSAEIHLYRDFFPISPPEGRPMVAYLILSASPPETWPGPVTDVTISVIRDSLEVWHTTMIFQGIYQDRNDAHVYRAGGGPLWDPGVYPGTLVDVVIRVRTSQPSVSLAVFHNVPVTKTS